MLSSFYGANSITGIIACAQNIENTKSTSRFPFEKNNNNIYLHYALGKFEQFSYALDVNITTDHFFYRIFNMTRKHWYKKIKIKLKDNTVHLAMIIL